MTVCLDGQSLDKNLTSPGASPPIVLLGPSACDTSRNTTWNASRLCCIASMAQVAGPVNVSVYVAAFGYALHSTTFAGIFTYTEAPRLFAITPASGHAGSLISIEMDAVDGGAMRDVPTVMLGGVACTSVHTFETTYTSYDTAKSMHVSCNVSDAMAGALPVHVTVPGVGDAVGNLTFTIQSAITAIYPTSGSAGGGTLLTLYGTGFNHLGLPPQAVGAGGYLGDGGICLERSPETGACARTSAQTEAADVNHLLTIGGQACAVQTLSQSVITCLVPPVVSTSTALQPWINTFYPAPPIAPPPLSST